MEIALESGAKVIGVNNRNLHTFQLDLDTTARAIRVAEAKGVRWHPTPLPSISTSTSTSTSPPPDAGQEQGAGAGDQETGGSEITLVALSGITTAEDVQVLYCRYKSNRTYREVSSSYLHTNFILS